MNAPEQCPHGFLEPACGECTTMRAELLQRAADRKRIATAIFASMAIDPASERALAEQAPVAVRLADRLIDELAQREARDREVALAAERLAQRKRRQHASGDTTS